MEIANTKTTIYTQKHKKHKKKSNPNNTLKTVTKPQEKITKEEEKKKDVQKQMQNN